MAKLVRFINNVLSTVLNALLGMDGLIDTCDQVLQQLQRVLIHTHQVAGHAIAVAFVVVAMLHTLSISFSTTGFADGLARATRSLQQGGTK